MHYDFLSSQCPWLVTINVPCIYSWLVKVFSPFLHRVLPKQSSNWWVTTKYKTSSYYFAIQLFYSIFLHHFAYAQALGEVAKRRVYKQVSMHVGVKHSVSKQDSETINKWYDCQTYFLLQDLTINCSKSRSWTKKVLLRKVLLSSSKRLLVFVCTWTHQ